MAGGSHGHRNSSIGHNQSVPKNYGGKQITSSHYGVRQGQQSSSHQKTLRASYVDKQTGKYTSATNKEVISTGETFKERSTGRVGYKDEYKTTSTYRVGDKRGYIEHQLEERTRRVDYAGSSSYKKAKYGVETYQNSGGAAISYHHYNNYEESDGDEGVEDYSNHGKTDTYEESDANEGSEDCSSYEESDGYDSPELDYYSDSD